jgi:hypothetical protein
VYPPFELRILNGLKDIPENWPRHVAATYEVIAAQKKRARAAGRSGL